MYFDKVERQPMIIDAIQQRIMMRNLRKVYGKDVNITKCSNGSLYVASDAPKVIDWKIDGPSDFDKFIKRYGMTGVDEYGNTKPYTMASRGTVESSKNVTMIMPEYKKTGRRWTIIQEEARPIDIARRGTDARVLAFPAGIIGDEAAFASESAMDSAVRELGEETGLVAKKVIKLAEAPIMTSPGLTDESTYFFKAFVDKLKLSQKALTDGGVTRGWYFVPIKKIPAWLKSMEKLGKILSGQTHTALSLNSMMKKVRI